MYNYNKSTLENERTEMYEALIKKLERIYMKWTESITTSTDRFTPARKPWPGLPMTYLCGYYFLKHYIKKFSPVAPERSLPVGMESANCGIHQFLCNYLLSAAAVSINTTHYIFIQTMVLSRTAPLPQIASLQPAPWPGLLLRICTGIIFLKHYIK